MAQVCSARLSQSDWRVSLRRGDHMGGGQPVQCTVQYCTGPAHCTLYCRKQTQKELLCPDDSTVSVFTLTRVPSRCSKQAQCVQSAIQLYYWLLCLCLGPAPHHTNRILHAAPPARVFPHPGHSEKSRSISNRRGEVLGWNTWNRAVIIRPMTRLQ